MQVTETMESETADKRVLLYGPWRRKWQPTPVSLPGESHGQRSLGGYTPWGRRVDMTERLSTEVAQYEHMEGYAETPEGLFPGGELYVV